MLRSHSIGFILNGLYTYTVSECIQPSNNNMRLGVDVPVLALAFAPNNNKIYSEFISLHPTFPYILAYSAKKQKKKLQYGNLNTVYIYKVPLISNIKQQLPLC